MNSQGNMHVVHEYKKFFEILVKTNIYKQLHVHRLHTSKKIIDCVRKSVAREYNILSEDVYGEDR